MNKLILLILILYSFCYSLYGRSPHMENEVGNVKHNLRLTGGVSQSASIDQLDSVIFDLSQAIFTSNSVEIPVSIISNDTIFALDFSFQYDQNNLLLDSIVDQTNYMISSSYYNTVDSTERFTSYSTQSYSKGISLVTIKFSLLNGMIGANDLFSMMAYLNGDPCSINVKGALPMNLNERDRINYQLDLFPSQATTSIHIRSSLDENVSIIDMNGKVIIGSINIFKNQESIIDIHNLPNGNYIVLFTNDVFSSTKKLTVLH